MTLSLATPLLLAGLVAGAAPSAAPGPGDPLPAFRLLDLEGAVHTPQDHRGEVLVMYFAMWCSVCRANAVEIQRELQEPLAAHGVRALAVDYLGNPRDEVVSLAQDLGLRYPVLLDDGTLTGHFGSKMALTLVVDRTGMLRYADHYDPERVEALVRKLAGAPPRTRSPAGPPPPRAPPPHAHTGSARPAPHAPPPSAGERGPVQSIHGRQADGYLGFAVLDRVVDLDRDGYPDLVASSQGPDGGTISVWRGGERGFPEVPHQVLRGPEAGDRLGGALLARDLDGDGFVDLVAADGWSRDRPRKVRVFPGSRRGLAEAPALVLRDEKGAAGFGAALAAGDLDGDGRIDLLIATSGPEGRGAVEVRYGRPAAWFPQDPDSVVVGSAARDAFGTALLVADADGDGREDLLAGAPGANAGGTDRGAVHVFRGRGERIPSRLEAGRADLVIPGESDLDEFGAHLAAVGDLDGDGRLDLAVSATGSRRGGRMSGAVYLYYGPLGRQGASALPAAGADHILSDGGPDAIYGVTVVGAGDLDGDGVDDLAVGAMNAREGELRTAGSVFLYRGNRGRSLVALDRLRGLHADGRLGRGVAPLGGGRLAVTEIRDSTHAPRAGALHVFALPRIAEETECSLCGMTLDRYRHTRFEALARDGSHRAACGAQCGLRMRNDLAERFLSARATDFITGRAGDAAAMVYLFRSEAIPDMSPGFIAFARRADAERFQRGFGGEILTFAEALERVRAVR